MALEQQTDYVKKYREMSFNIYEKNPNTHPDPEQRKAPKGKWKKFQTEIYSGPIDPKDGLIVFCGKTSNNLVVIDLDDHDLLKHFSNFIGSTFIVKTGKKGYHLYFRMKDLPNSRALNNSQGQHIDIQSQGKITVLPPSIHPETNKPYEIISDNKVMVLTRYNFQSMLEKIEKLGFSVSQKKSNGNEIRQGVKEGNRNKAAFDLAREYQRLDLDDNEVMDLMKKWNEKNIPPLDYSELETVVKSAKKYPWIEKQNENKTETEIFELKRLSEIDNERYADKRVRVKAIIASNSISYSVPKKVTLKCVKEHDDCVKTKTHNLDLMTSVKFVDTNDSIKAKYFESFKMVSFTPKCDVVIKEYSESITIKKVRVRPVIESLILKDKKFFDDAGNELNPYDVYIVHEENQHLNAGQEVIINGIVTHDSKNSKITLIAEKVEIVEDDPPDFEKIKELQQFFKNKNPESIFDWYAEEFEKYSKIIKRKDIAICELLTPFSALYLDFQGDIVPGWLKVNVIGDSTVGKTETCRKIMKLIKRGQMITGELASVAGIAGAAVQTSNNNWICDFGVLPMNDRKWLIIDGAHSLGAEEKSKTAEAERNGELEIHKAGKLSAYARTRLTRIENPLDEDKRTTVTMGFFLHPIQSLIYNYQLQSIARIDLACFVEDDIKPEDRNQKILKDHDKRLENLAELVKVVWSKKYSVEFTDNAIDAVLRGATTLERKFKVDEIPLVSNDEWLKLAKISAAVAALCCNFKDNDPETLTVIIDKKHVEYAVNLKDTIYSKSGLDGIANQNKSGDIDLEKVWEIAWNIEQKCSDFDKEKALNVFRWIAEKQHFKKEDLTEQFELTRDKQLNPLIRYLNDENLIKRSKTHFSSTKKMVSVVKYCDNPRHSSRSSEAKVDTPLKKINQKKGVSILDSLESLERRIFPNFTCSNCHSIWKKPEVSIDEIRELHKKSHENEDFEIVEVT